MPEYQKNREDYKREQIGIHWNVEHALQAVNLLIHCASSLHIGWNEGNADFVFLYCQLCKADAQIVELSVKWDVVAFMLRHCHMRKQERSRHELSYYYIFGNYANKNNELL